MQFQVPQFIDIEDRIFGPLTFKQFIYIVGSGGIGFILYKTLPFFLAILVALPIIALGMTLAFYKVNNKPFISILEASIRYFSAGKLYIWKKEPKKVTQKRGGGDDAVSALQLPRLSDSKLKDIAWSLGVKDSVYAEQVEKNNKK